MFPNTLGIYSGDLDPQTGYHASEGDAFRISDDGQKGEFRIVLGGGKRIDVVIQHSVQNGKAPAVALDRHTIRVAKTKVDAASGAEDTASASLTVTAPRRGFENDELVGLANALLNILFGGGTNTSDSVGLGNIAAYPTLAMDALLSGAI